MANEIIESFKTGWSQGGLRAKLEGAIRRGDAETAVKTAMEIHSSCQKRRSECTPRDCLKCKY